MSLPLVQYVLTAALRDRLIVSLMVVLVLAVSLSVFFGSAAVNEQDQFSLVYAGGGIRMAGIFGLVLFVVFFMRRSYEAKDIEFLLSRPVGRIEFLLSYAAAFSILAVLMGLAQGICLLILGAQFGEEGHMLWVASLMVENIIMVNVALFFSMLLSSAASGTMAVFALYTLARMNGEILGIIDHKGENTFEGLEYAMQLVSAITPRLDLMAQTSWLVYGVGEQVNLTYIVLQGALFTALILLAALIDLVKRQF